MSDQEERFRQLQQLMFQAQNQPPIGSNLADLLAGPEFAPSAQPVSREPEQLPEDPWLAAQELPEEPKPKKPKASVEHLPAGNAFVEGMVKRGWTPEEAAGAAGNVHVESGFRPGVKSGVPNESSYGFLQWNKERLQGLQNMAMQTNRDWRDPEAQMDWINMERTGESVRYGGGDERTAYRRALAGGGSPEEIAERFGRFVERPAKLSDTVDMRRQAAARYASMFGKTMVV